MKKVSVFLVLVASFILTANMVMAEPQSPIYTDDIGRSHFLGRGGYSTIRQVHMQGMEANVVNDAVNEFSQKEAKNQEVVEQTERTLETVEKTTTNITDVIKEKPTVPVSSRKATFTSEQRKMDASAPFGMGTTNLNSGVNESKTLYTDDLGRLHFFGRANQIRE